MADSKKIPLSRNVDKDWEARQKVDLDELLATTEAVFMDTPPAEFPVSKDTPPTESPVSMDTQMAENAVSKDTIPGNDAVSKDTDKP